MAAKKIRTNENQLVEMAVQGQVMFPRFFGWEVTHDGRPMAMPSVGGIVYNVMVGDSVYDFFADHVEPGVTATAGTDKLKQNPNSAFLAYSCLGNKVKLISGEAKGQTGVVTGHHGGVEHTLIYFPKKTLDKMSQDDKMIIRGYGLGLRLLDYPKIALEGISPKLLNSMEIQPIGGGIQIPVAAKVPAFLMGSGLGSDEGLKGDVDIQTSDLEVLKQHGLGGLRFGDLVAVMDHHSHWGYSYQKGAVSIGVIVHGNSFLAGHGPGVQMIMSCPKGGGIQPTIKKDANIGRYLKVGRWDKQQPKKAKKRATA